MCMNEHNNREPGYPDLIDVLREYRHICWYPSAGSDPMGLHYISEYFYQKYKIPMDDEQSFPDLFLFTNINCDTTDYAAPLYVRDNFITQLFNKALKRGNFPLDGYGSRNWGSIDILSVRALAFRKLEDTEDFCSNDSEKEGCSYLIKSELSLPEDHTSNVDILYYFTENTRFARDILMHEQIPVEYVIQIRYGGSFGGSSLKGDWLKHTFRAIGCRYFIANPQYAERDLDMENETVQRFFEGYDTQAPELKEILSMDGKEWSDSGKVCWYKVNM